MIQVSWYLLYRVTGALRVTTMVFTQYMQRLSKSPGNFHYVGTMARVLCALSYRHTVLKLWLSRVKEIRWAIHDYVSFWLLYSLKRTNCHFRKCEWNKQTIEYGNWFFYMNFVWSMKLMYCTKQTSYISK